MLDPLNPTLYSLLQRKFGNVKIAHAGEELRGRYRQEQVSRGRKTELVLRLKVDTSGEEYLVNCPFCNDTRGRLLINHRWGVRDAQTGSLNLWLMQCMNEGCQEDYDNQQALYDQLFSIHGKRRQVRIKPGRRVADAPLTSVELPGEHILLEDLMARDPRHHAVKYLQGRGFDPVYLSQVFKVGYCPRSKYALAEDRIVIPIEMDGMLVGWQARMIGDWKAGDPPKYWTCPGTSRSKLAYNFNTAVKHSTVVIVEGPGDVWGFGAQSMGLLGKTMSVHMQNRLRCGVAEGSTVVIMLDPKQDSVSESKGKQHHIEKLYEQLVAPLKARRINLLKVYLPIGSDPGSLESSFMKRAIKLVAKEEGISVAFKKMQVEVA